MAKILIKRSDVSGFVPAKSDLSIGELQLNTTDGKLFMKKSILAVESIVEIGKDAGTAIKLNTARKINGVLFDGTQDISFGTNNVVEESNLYYTQARFNAAFGAKSTTNLLEGNNLYYTNARASAAAPVQSVCGRIGNIILNSSDITTALGYVPTQTTSFAVGGIKGAVMALDSRSITNPLTGIGYATGARFRFAFSNDVDTANNYSDVIDLSTYNDVTGGGFNSLYFNKGLQQIVHKFGPAGATTWTTKTLAYTDSAITGNAASASTATKLTTARRINGVLFDGTQDIAFGTANVPEGTNLYFTNARASAAAPVQSVFGRTGYVVMNASDVVTALGYTPTNSSGAGTPGGAATLDANGKLLASQVPAIAISDTFVVASQAAMLALSGADIGDIAVRTDLSKSFILKATGYSTLANWQELLTPVDVVQSVNGQTGTVTLSTSNIPEGSNLYFTNARAAAAAPVQPGSAASFASVSTTSILVGNGSAASPSIGFLNEPVRDTGFYWISDGVIGIASNGQASASFGPGSVLNVNTINANSFVGSLNGNAATATLATNVAGIVAIANGGTSATTAAAARANLGLAVVSGVDGYSTMLGSGTDLNTILNTGFYRGTGFVNAPENNTLGWYYVTVEGHDTSWTKQTATSYGSNNVSNITFTRTRVTGTWGGWVTAYNGNVIVPVTNGGTGSAVAETAAANLGVPRINPTTPKDGDVKVAAGPTISIYATGAWRQIFPAVYV